MKWLKCMLFGWHALVIWESAGRWPKSHQATTKGSKYFNFKVFGAMRIGWGRRLCRVWQPHGSCLQPQLQETLVVGILKGTSEIPFPDVSRVKAPTTPTPATANKGMAKWHALQHDGAGMNKLIHTRPICCHPFWDTNRHTWHYFIPAFTFNAGSAFNACTSLRGWSSGPQRAWRSGARKKTSWYTVMSRPLFPSISTNVFLFVSAFLYCCLVTGATIHNCHVLTVQWILLEGSLHRKSNRAMGGHTNKVPPFFPRHVSKCRRQADSGSAMYPWDSVCRKRPPTKMKQHNLMTIGKHMGEPVPPYLSKSIAYCAYMYMFNYTAKVELNQSDQNTRRSVETR